MNSGEIEKMARALVRSFGNDPDEVVLIGEAYVVAGRKFMRPTQWNNPLPVWQHFIGEAEMLLKSGVER